MSHHPTAARRRRTSLAALLALCACSVAALLPTTAAGAARDPVLTAIVKADKKGAITGAQRKKYVAMWRYSGRTATSLRNRGKIGRAQEIGNVCGIQLRLARRGRLTPERLEPTFTNIAATTYVMLHRGFPSHEDRIRVPNEPVVFAYYRGQGVQFQPLFTFTWANIQYSLKNDDELLKIINRLNELKTTGRGYPTWEYYFDYQGGVAPWVSGMAHGQGMTLFAKAWERSGVQKYRDVAEAGLVGFGRSPREGGFMTYQNTGRWYLLYAFAPRQRILNGHLQSLIALYDYYDITTDEKARELLNQGIAGVLPLMPKFDTGAWSMYSLESEADLNYHDLMTTQLRKLYNRTQITQFADQAQRFETYRATPPQVAVPDQQLEPVYPVFDGFRDSFTLRYFVDKRARHVIRIKDVNGATVRTLRQSGGRGKFTMRWNGRNEKGKAVSPGGYTIHFSTTDIIGNRRDGQLTQLIDVKRDETAPEPISVRVRSHGRKQSQIVLAVKDAESPYIVVKVMRRGKVLATRRMSGKLAFLVPQPIASMRRAYLVLSDTTGNQRRVPL